MAPSLLLFNCGDYNNESAQKRRLRKTRKGYSQLRTTLILCAHSAVKVKSSYFYAQYMRICAHRGKKKTLLAVAHSTLIAIYHILKDDTLRLRCPWLPVSNMLVVRKTRQSHLNQQISAVARRRAPLLKHPGISSLWRSSGTETYWLRQSYRHSSVFLRCTFYQESGRSGRQQEIPVRQKNGDHPVFILLWENG